MRTVRTVAELRERTSPTPGAPGARSGWCRRWAPSTQGHLSLMRRAREACDVVVVSLFVNPAQFNEAARPGRLSPRRGARRGPGRRRRASTTCSPQPVTEVYPDGFATSVAVRGLTDGLEGAHRGHGHFDGVTTVVSKLLNMVGPDVAYFGQKDAQQAAVVRRLVRDLNFPVRIEVCPTVRADDGLALSSRNVLLTAAERDQAAALYRALRAVQAAVAAGERDPEAAAAPATPSWPRRASSPSTWPSWRRTRWSR